MRKIILGLFIILFCFILGLADNQEDKSLKKKVDILDLIILESKLQDKLESLKLPKLEEFSKEEIIIEILELKKLIEEHSELLKLYYETEYESLRNKYNSIRGLFFETISWQLNYPSGRYLEEIREENDRLENLIMDLETERFMLSAPNPFKPDPFDYYMALSFATSMIPVYDLPYSPKYLKRNDLINYMWLYLLLDKK